MPIFQFVFKASVDRSVAKINSGRCVAYGYFFVIRSPLRDSTSMVTHSAGRVSNSINIVVNAGSMTKGTKKRKAKRLKVPRRMKNAVV